MCKLCIGCNTEKELSYFPKRKDSKDGYRNMCKIFHKAEATKYRNKNKNTQKEYQKIYRKNNIEKATEYRKKFANKYSAYRTEKKKINPLFKLSCNLRNLTYNAFRKNGFSKNSKTSEILGCSYEQVKMHLEAKFINGMNWQNHGILWDIDHIIPLSSATTKEEMCKLNHYSNLQPLDSYINRYIKRDLMDYK
jgi:hypothetical protein